MNVNHSVPSDKNLMICLQHQDNSMFRYLSSNIHFKNTFYHDKRFAQYFSHPLFSTFFNLQVTCMRIST